MARYHAALPAAAGACRLGVHMAGADHFRLVRIAKAPRQTVTIGSKRAARKGGITQPTAHGAAR